MESNKERRVPVRYKSDGLRVKIIDESNTTHGDNLCVLDMSLEGCSLVVADQLSMEEGDSISMSFYDQNLGSIENPIDGVVVFVDNLNDCCRCGVRFNSSIRPESLGEFNKYFFKVIDNPETKKSLFDRQRVVAKNDLEAIRRDVLHLKSCQFQLVLGALPLFAAQWASMIPIFSMKELKELPVWTVTLPIICAFLAYMMLLVFLQKTGSIRRNLAFVMILQRHMVMGSFPECYRGWQDAYENYNHILRYGDKNKYNDGQVIKEKNVTRILPTDAFTWLGVGVLGVVPIVSVILLWVMSRVTMHFALAPYTFLVWGTSLITGVAYLYVSYLVWTLLKGRGTFRNMMIVFSKLLKHSPFFDPKGLKPL